MVFLHEVPLLMSLFLFVQILTSLPPCLLLELIPLLVDETFLCFFSDFRMAGISDYAEIVEEEDDYSTPDGKTQLYFFCFFVLFNNWLLFLFNTL